MHVLNIFISKNSIGILGASFLLIVPLVWKSFFIEKDVENALKKFKYKNNLYMVNVIAIIYYILFSALVFLSNFYESYNFHFLSGNFPVFSLTGMIILLFSMGINVLIMNVIIRDS